VVDLLNGVKTDREEKNMHL